MPDGKAPGLTKPAVASPPGAALATTSAVVVTIAALYFGREILMPLALALLLAFVMSPPVLWLRRRGLPRIAAVVLVVLTSFATIGGVAVVVGTQLVQLAQNLPDYQRNIGNKLASLRSSVPGSSMLERVGSTLEGLRQQLSMPQPSANDSQAPATSSGNEPRREPIPVIVESAPMQPLDVIRTVLGPLLGPLATAALVVLFLFFILIERDEMRDRFIKLVGGGDLQRSTEAITEAGDRVSRYLMMQLVVNVTYGIPIGVGLYLIGVPNAALWGVLAAVLRFIPYLGPWLAALFPIVITFGVDPGWSMLLWSVALFLVIELISNNAIEPWLYGASTGLSSLAIILAAIFWTLLWGPAGLFLATPLTVCLVVIGRYVPGLEFLEVLFGSEPVLTPAERLCQRLMSGNVEEAVELAEAHIDEHSTQSFYDDVVIPALKMTEGDRQRGSNVELRRVVADSAMALVGEIEEHVADGDEKNTKAEPRNNRNRSDRPGGPSRVRVLCIGGRTELDLAAARIVASRLQEIGVTASTIAAMQVSPTAMGQLDLQDVEVICLSYFHPRPQIYARYVCRRLERRAPNISKVVCCWNGSAGSSWLRELETKLGDNAVVVATLAEAEKQILAALSPSAESARISALPPHEQALLAELRELARGTRNDERFADIAVQPVERGNGPVFLIAPIEEAGKAAAGGGKRETSRQIAGLLSMICSEVVVSGQPIFVEDVAKDDRFSDNSELLEKGVRRFAAEPLRTASGAFLGALCLFDSTSRPFDEAELRQLRERAADIMLALESKSPSKDASAM